MKKTTDRYLANLFGVTVQTVVNWKKDDKKRNMYQVLKNYLINENSTIRYKVFIKNRTPLVVKHSELPNLVTQYQDKVTKITLEQENAV